MPKNSKLPATRIETETYEKIVLAIERFNSANAGEINISSFIRMAVKDFAEQILHSERITLKIE